MLERLPSGNSLYCTIAASPFNVYAYATATERWPDLLAPYRRVRVLAQHGSVRVVEIGAWLDMIPVGWVAEQISDPAAPSVRFRHVHGFTRGTDVEWSFAAVPGGTRVTVDVRALEGTPLGSRVVRRVTRKTLAAIKSLIESAKVARTLHS